MIDEMRGCYLLEFLLEMGRKMKKKRGRRDDSCAGEKPTYERNKELGKWEKKMRVFGRPRKEKANKKRK